MEVGHYYHQFLHSVGWGFPVTLRVYRLLRPLKGQIVTYKEKDEHFFTVCFNGVRIVVF